MANFESPPGEMVNEIVGKFGLTDKSEMKESEKEEETLGSQERDVRGFSLLYCCFTIVL